MSCPHKQVGNAAAATEELRFALELLASHGHHSNLPRCNLRLLPLITCDLTTTSFQVEVESNGVSPPFLWAKQPQIPQSLLIRLALQSLHHLCYPSLNMLQQQNVLLAVRDTKLNPVFKMKPHQS